MVHGPQGGGGRAGVVGIGKGAMVGEEKKKRRLRVKWTVFELQSLEREWEPKLVTPCASFTVVKAKAQRWIRESGRPCIEYVILPVYQVEEVE